MSVSTLESLALEMFEEEYEREAREAASRRRVRRTAAGPVEVCPVAWVMSDLLCLIAERHAEPVETLRPCIRRLIREKAFAFGPATSGLDGYTHADEAVDQEVDLIIRALERVRSHALACGQWSEMDCTAEQFVG